MNRVYLVGATQEARTAANLLMERDPLVDLEVFVEKGYGELGTRFHGLHIYGYIEALAALPVTGSLVFVDPNPPGRAQAVGWKDRAMAEGRAWPVKSLKAATAVIASSVKIGIGSIVLPGAVIMDGAEIGNYVIIGPNVVVGAESRVSDFSTLQAGTILGPRAYVGKGGLCGLGAVISAQRRVGAWSHVLDGFHLRRDLPPGKST